MHMRICPPRAACVWGILATVAAAQGAAANNAEPAWSVEGQWADACNCQAPCPCWRREVPTAGDCGDLFYFHIEKGHYGELKRYGLDVVQIFKTAGGKSMAQSRKDKDVAIANTYTSKDLEPAVAAALETIFLRLSPTQLPSAKLRATKRVAFAATMGSERVTIEIPGVLTIDLKATKDASRKPMPFPYSMKAVPWTVGSAVQAESVVYNFNDDGISWEIKQSARPPSPGSPIPPIEGHCLGSSDSASRRLRFQRPTSSNGPEVGIAATQDSVVGLASGEPGDIHRPLSWSALPQG